MRRECLLGLLVLWGLAGCSSKPAPETVRVGQLLPLEGANRSLGQHARQGVELALADARGSGETIAGHPVTVLHVDNREDAGTVQAETVRLLTVNRAVALLGGFDASLTERMIRESRSYKVPVIVPGELSGPADSDAVLSLGVPPAVRGRLLARYASTNLKLSRAAVLIDSRRPVAAALAAAFVKAWPRDKGGKIEDWTYATAAERDERLAQLIKTDPSVVLLACSVADFRLLRPQLATALPKAPLLHGGEDVGVAALQAELEAQPDVYLATAFSTEHLSEIGQDFARRYQERFHEPADLHAAQSYDAARLLFDAMQRAGTPSREALLKELAQLQEFDSVTGRMHWKDRQPRRRVFLMALKKNEPKVVSIVEADEN